MSDIAILKEMITENAKVPLVEGNYGKNKIVLEEKSELLKYSVTIHGMPNEDEVIIIKADEFVAPTAVFKEVKGKGVCKRADFVIIADTPTKKFIIIIEMKAGKGENNEIIQQLKGAWCFVLYCQSIGQKFWNKPEFLQGYEYRFVSIKNITGSKKPSRSQQKTIHNLPENRLVFSSQKYIEFNHLIAGVKKK